ncbi:hypothetical protein HII17_05035 [Thalassotalea sp. M1531]|uniref:DUF1795 domain-containing protein n=1 Tax=Thalassotalea algicola TaxID=2716224 RepID=A0A7Y0LAT6_9GAMM|nr:hypothetical protein [Thalassotalea algicola]NMP30922.1 hypothetical protein [Thalassotalea algicola]
MKLVLFVKLAVIFLACAFLNLQANAANTISAKYMTGQTQGWKYELIPFPLSFAPEIKLVGEEELYFAPGMYEPVNTNFFSYVFVWQFDGTDFLTIGELSRYMKAYYKGLYKAVAKQQQAGGEKVDISIKGSKAVGSGSILWLEPFVTNKRQKLHFSYQQLTCPNQKQVQLFVQVSPQLKSSEIWQKLSAITAKGCS